MNTRISQVFRDADGKVQRIVCGQFPQEVTEFERVEVEGERLFRLGRYGKHKLFKPNKKTRHMEYVRSIRYNKDAGNAAKVATEGRCSLGVSAFCFIPGTE